jgi:rod shape-determining protein MreC
MQQIIYFIIKNSYRLLFLLLLSISLMLTIQSHSYHRSQYIHSANSISGYTYEKINNVREYFGLRAKNEELALENARLKELLFNTKDTVIDLKSAPSFATDFRVIPARVIKNSYEKQENFITLDRGNLKGIKGDMGVISDRGVVGIVDKTTKNFATVISILHTNNPINGKIKNSNHFGSITWDGKNTGYVQLIDVPKLATLKKGDTIVTGGQSYIFPENIPVGKIDKIFIDKSTNKFVINVRLFNDMTNLGYVYIIENKKRKEKEILEAASEKEVNK